MKGHGSGDRPPRLNLSGPLVFIKAANRVSYRFHFKDSPWANASSLWIAIGDSSRMSTPRWSRASRWMCSTPPTAPSPAWRAASTRPFCSAWKSLRIKAIHFAPRSGDPLPWPISRWPSSVARPRRKSMPAIRASRAGPISTCTSPSIPMPWFPPSPPSCP